MENVAETQEERVRSRVNYIVTDKVFKQLMKDLNALTDLHGRYHIAHLSLAFATNPES